MKKRFFSLLLALVMVLGLAACAAEPDISPVPSDSAPAQSDVPSNVPEDDLSDTPRADFVFTDDVGRQVELPGEITRIVPSSALGQMILFAIAPDMLVGLASSFYDSARGIIDDKYFDLPEFGSLYASADLNVEELALTAPQLIIDIGEAKSSITEDMDALQTQTGIPSVFLSATLETMPETFRKLGALLNRPEKAEELAQFCEKVYDRTLSIMNEVGENRVNALYVLGDEGLNVIAAGSYHSELLDLLTNNLAVVDNPVGKGSGNEVTMEQIALWNPDFVIFGPRSIYGEVAEMPAWQDITAIQNGDYVLTPDTPHNWMSMPPSVQRYLGLIWLTYELYPDYCDYDVQADIMEYYRLFYSCTLTEEQYATITAGAFREG